MSITLSPELSPAPESFFQAFVERALTQALELWISPGAPPKRRRAADLIGEIWKDIPEEVLEKAAGGRLRTDRPLRLRRTEASVTNVVFADTFFFVALTNWRDAHHHQAVRLDAELDRSYIVTTDEVLIEFLAFFAADSWQRARAATVVDRLLAEPSYVVLPQSRTSFLAGLDLYKARPDKGYSLTDCISMTAMRQNGILDILTKDEPFSQEGFRALFRS